MSLRGLFGVSALLGVVWLAMALLIAPAAPYTIDGAMYHAMAEAAAERGSFFLDNGYETYRSSALAPTLTTVADGRLSPQYPGLWGFWAAPAYLLAGVRGLMAMNALAGAVACYFVGLAAWRLSSDERVAWQAALIFGLAGFFTEYAVGVWPHTPAMMVAAMALAAATKFGEAGEGAAALWAGLLIGIGANIRVDAVFLGAALAVWALWRAERPFAVLGLFLAGVAPGIVAASAVNWVKFGAISPLTYGKSGGTTSLGYYTAFAPVILAAGAGLLALGLSPVRRILSLRFVIPALLLVGVGAAYALPPLRPLITQLGEGAWVLFFNGQDFPLSTRSAALGEDGVLRFYGIVKPALLQSLPFAAAAICAFLREDWRKGPLLLTLVIAATAAPFALSSWHGGLGNNMRYLLPAAMALAILTAMALQVLAQRGRRGFALPLLVAVLLVAGGALLAPSLRLAVELTILNVALIAVAVLSAVVILAPKPVEGLAVPALKGGLIAGFVGAGLSGGLDVADSFRQRALNGELARLTADLPEGALLTGFSYRIAEMRFNRPGALTAQADVTALSLGAPAIALIEQVMAEGRPVFLQGRALAEEAAGLGLGEPGEGRYDLPPIFEVYELTPLKSGETQ